MILTQTCGTKKPSLKILFLATICFSITTVFGQSEDALFKNLVNKLVTKKQICASIDDLYKKTEIWDSANHLNYLKPLVNCLSLDITNSSESVKSAYYEQLGFLLSLWSQDILAQKVYDSMKYYNQSDTNKLKQKEIDYYKKFTLKSAIGVIEDSLKVHKIVMLNEAHHVSFHRMFGLSLLESLHKNGFRYLAMETLTNSLDSKPITSINSRTGYYSIEPVMAEFMRKALDLGFTLVPYEYDQLTQPSNLRDSIQAENILKIVKKDPKAKIFVYAGYGHIEKASFPGYRPLGFMIDKISSITPYSIDQVKFNTGYFPSRNQQIYNVLDSTQGIKTSSALFEEGRPYEIYNLGLYDLHIVHPSNSFIKARPSWLFTNGKKACKISVPKKIRTHEILVLQAYYTNETYKDDFGKAIPADQNLLLNKTKETYLALGKGSYTIVWRNKNYQILEKNIIQVK